LVGRLIGYKQRLENDVSAARMVPDGIPYRTVAAINRANTNHLKRRAIFHTVKMLRLVKVENCRFALHVAKLRKSYTAATHPDTRHLKPPLTTNR
jgi:hypothetical protein